MPLLTLTTWNCFGTAQSLRAALRWRGAVDSHRFAHPTVTASLLASDVLCLQEVFLADVEELFDKLEHAHKVRDDNRTRFWPLTLGGSGLGLASRFPIVQSEIAAFPGPHRGSERFARKGLLYARIAIPSDEHEGPREIDVLTTHLQSGYDRPAEIVRARQLATLRAWVDRRGDATRPFVVCGDFNICALATQSGEYRQLREVFHDFVDLHEEANEPTFHPHPDVNLLAHRFEANSPKQRIDYVLYRKATADVSPPPRCEIVLRERLQSLSGADTHASDHFALRITL